MTDRLHSQIIDRLHAAGWQVSDTDDKLNASREAILAKWWFGSRRLSLHLKCRFDAASRTVFYREMIKEVTFGVPPPTLGVSHRSQHGLDVDEIRRDSGPFGSGALHYGEVRHWLQALCTEAG